MIKLSKAKPKKVTTKAVAKIRINTKAVHNYKHFCFMSGRWVWFKRNVVVMAASGKWAMVRCKGCVPYAALVSEITFE